MECFQGEGCYWPAKQAASCCLLGSTASLSDGVYREDPIGVEQVAGAIVAAWTAEVEEIQS